VVSNYQKGVLCCQGKETEYFWQEFQELSLQRKHRKWSKPNTPIFLTKTPSIPKLLINQRILLIQRHSQGQSLRLKDLSRRWISCLNLYPHPFLVLLITQLKINLDFSKNRNYTRKVARAFSTIRG
jgi:hypothetical protein